jgi:hypothetical protein
MINVSIDMWVHGDHMETYNLGRVTITNNGRGSKSRGDYIVRAFGRDGKPIREALIENWPRNSRPVFELLKLGLEKMGYK